MLTTRRVLMFSVPLLVFVTLCFFLAAPLLQGSDPRRLDSALIGKALPAFTLQDLYQPEKQHDAVIFQGRKMLLNVWATWCATCYAEHQFLNELAAQGIYIVGMNYKDDRDKAIQWLTALKDPYQLSLFDENGMLGLDLGVYGAPETFFIDSKGIIQYRHVGDINADIWQNKLSAIFARME